jgi:hypothetical protein
VAPKHEPKLFGRTLHVVHRSEAAQEAGRFFQLAADARLVL